MVDAQLEIKSVTIEPNPVFTGEKFKIIADVIQFESQSGVMYFIFSSEHEEDDIGFIT